MMIVMLIGIMIAIVVGVSVIPVITETTKAVTSDPNTPSSLSAVANILPIILLVVIVMGAVAFMGGGFGDREGKSVTVKVTKNKKSFILEIERQTSKLEPYINNLDKYLGITTMNYGRYGDYNSNSTEKFLGLDSATKELTINSESFDWYIVDKHEELPMFKVVGLHKKDAEKNVAYLLGKNPETNKPYLISLPKYTIPLESSGSFMYSAYQAVNQPSITDEIREQIGYPRRPSK